MPLFNEENEEFLCPLNNAQSYTYNLESCVVRGIPITSVEFNPPPVSVLEKQSTDYWKHLTEPDQEDLKVLKALRSKAESLASTETADAFASITDSAAGILRMHNLTMLTLLADPTFCEQHLGVPRVDWEPNRTVIHLTRNHSVYWLRQFLNQCRNLGLKQLLLITGDPLKEVRLKTVDASTALALSEEESKNYRLKNSVALTSFIKSVDPSLTLGVGHNPYMKQIVAEKHLGKKVDAGASFVITQPVSYYEECWGPVEAYRKFCDIHAPHLTTILGVFNYAVPFSSKGFREDSFQKRYAFWKKLFGYVPDGVRLDYERGLNGVEILARSINKLKRMGYFHFDVMNAEKKGISIIENRRRFAFESDRISASLED